MNKFFRFLLPIIMACIFLGITIYLLTANSRAVASEYSTPESWVSKGVSLKPAGTRLEILVTTLENELNNDGDCSLREALQAANTNALVDACLAGNAILTDTITFDVAGIITVTSQLSVTTGGPLIIDGRDVITTSGNKTTRVWWVDSGSLLTLKRLVVANGYLANDSGAGLYNNGGYLTIDQVAFVGNRFTISDSLHYYGGGIYSAGGTLDVVDSRFEDNGSVDKYSHGGGIANINTTGQILRTTFQNNSSASCMQGIPCTHPGGGGYYQSYSSVTIQESIFISNTATYGGGGVYNRWGPLTIINSSFSGNSGAFGGGMTNGGEVTVSNSTFLGNSGSGIYNWGDITISNSTFLGNGAGGITNSGLMTITDSTFSGNQGSGISNDGHITIADCTFSGNSAAYGGGISSLPQRVPGAAAFLTISNSTFTGNHATNYGGGIYNVTSRTIITNTTFISNSADIGGGGVFNSWDYFINIPLTITNSILANSLVGGDCGGDYLITDGGHNISSDNTCGFSPSNSSMPNTDPVLGPLQDNGGPTWTQALLWGSPTIDAGDNAKCPSTDQRGMARPMDGNHDGLAMCDIGSYELEGSPYSYLFFPLVSKSY